VGPVLPDSKRGGAHPDYAPRAAYGSTDGGFALVGYSLSPPSSSSPSHRSMGDAARPWSCWPRSRKGFARVCCCSSRGAPPIAVVGAGRASSLRLVTRCAEEPRPAGLGMRSSARPSGHQDDWHCTLDGCQCRPCGTVVFGGRRRFGRCGEEMSFAGGKDVPRPSYWSCGQRGLARANFPWLSFDRVGARANLSGWAQGSLKRVGARTTSAFDHVGAAAGVDRNTPAGIARSLRCRDMGSVRTNPWLPSPEKGRGWSGRCAAAERCPMGLWRRQPTM